MILIWKEMHPGRIYFLIERSMFGKKSGVSSSLRNRSIDKSEKQIKSQAGEGSQFLQNDMKRFFFLAGHIVVFLLALTPSQLLAQAAGDYRSAASGNWNDTATWERFDGMGWVAPGATPTFADGVITIRSPHLVTNSASGLTIDQVVVDAGAQVTVAAGVTSVLTNAAGTDLVINGTWVNSGGTWTNSASATWSVGAGGTFVHNTTSGIATPLNSATLNAASTFIYRGATGLVPAISMAGRTYGNLRFESTSGTWSETGASTANTLTINGDFYIGTGVTYTTSMTGIMTFAGNFTIDGTLVNSAGTQIYTFTGSGKTISGAAATIQFETWNINSGASITLSHDTTISSNFTATVNGTLNCAANLTLDWVLAGSGNVNFSKTGAQTLSLTNTTILGSLLNITINNGSTTTVIGNIDAVTDGLPLTVASGGTLKGTAGLFRELLINGAISPGNSVQWFVTADETWNPGGSYVWEINDATGTLGGGSNSLASGWDFLNVIGNITVAATSGNPFTIKATSLSGATPGNMANFDKDVAKTWTIASAEAPQTVTNFAANKFTVDYSSVSNDLFGGSFTVVRETDDSAFLVGDSVRVKYTPNVGPAASPASFTRTNGASLKIDIAALLASNTSDPDLHGRALVSVRSTAGSMMSSNGIALSTNATHILLPASASSAEDKIDYVVVDLAPYRVGDSFRFATNTITITTVPAMGLAANYVSLTSSGGPNPANTIKFAGIPGYFYDVERTSDLGGMPIVWTVIGDEIKADDASGIVTYVDETPSSPAFYRVKFD